jgi:hypothetical protein
MRTFDEAQLDGRACVACGRQDGPMVPLGPWFAHCFAQDAGRQYFAHEKCARLLAPEAVALASNSRPSLVFRP